MTTNMQYWVPTSPLSGTLVMYYHGAGETGWSNTDNQKRGIMWRLLHSGHLVCASAASGDNYGNAAGITDYVNLYNYMNSNYTITKVLHLSQSMGGLAGLYIASNRSIPVHGWAGIYPMCDLAWAYSGASSFDFITPINTAYNIPAGGSYATQTAGRDPMLMTASTFNFPMRFYASASDTLVTKAANSDAMATKVSGIATESVVVTHTGGHGDNTAFKPNDLMAFFDRC